VRGLGDHEPGSVTRKSINSYRAAADVTKAFGRRSCFRGDCSYLNPAEPAEALMALDPEGA